MILNIFSFVICLIISSSVLYAQSDLPSEVTHNLDTRSLQCYGEGSQFWGYIWLLEKVGVWGELFFQLLPDSIIVEIIWPNFYWMGMGWSEICHTCKLSSDANGTDYKEVCAHACLDSISQIDNKSFIVIGRSDDTGDAVVDDGWGMIDIDTFYNSTLNEYVMRNRKNIEAAYTDSQFDDHETFEVPPDFLQENSEYYRAKFIRHYVPPNNGPAQDWSELYNIEKLSPETPTCLTYITSFNTTDPLPVASDYTALDEIIYYWEVICTNVTEYCSDPTPSPTWEPIVPWDPNSYCEGKNFELVLFIDSSFSVSSSLNRDFHISLNWTATIIESAYYCMRNISLQATNGNNPNLYYLKVAVIAFDNEVRLILNLNATFGIYDDGLPGISSLDELYYVQDLIRSITLPGENQRTEMFGTSTKDAIQMYGTEVLPLVTSSREDAGLCLLMLTDGLPHPFDDQSPCNPALPFEVPSSEIIKDKAAIFSLIALKAIEDTTTFQCLMTDTDEQIIELSNVFDLLEISDLVANKFKALVCGIENEICDYPLYPTWSVPPFNDSVERPPDWLEYPYDPIISPINYTLVDNSITYTFTVRSSDSSLPISLPTYDGIIWIREISVPIYGGLYQCLQEFSEHNITLCASISEGNDLIAECENKTIISQSNLAEGIFIFSIFLPTEADGGADHRMFQDIEYTFTITIDGLALCLEYEYSITVPCVLNPFPAFIPLNTWYYFDDVSVEYGEVSSICIPLIQVCVLELYDLPTPPPTPAPTQEPTTAIPTVLPTVHPTSPPTVFPTVHPTSPPTVLPTVHPTSPPTILPTSPPSVIPTTPPTLIPSVPPTVHPSSIPSKQPTSPPTLDPSSPPSTHPSSPPTIHPSSPPTTHPSSPPSTYPTSPPSTHPSSPPTNHPTSPPTVNPSSPPSVIPSSPPTINPSVPPSTDPSIPPTFNPTFPSLTYSPSSQPSSNPSNPPSSNPTNPPSSNPSQPPSNNPSNPPSANPTNPPSSNPSKPPSNNPSQPPSSYPTNPPSSNPSNPPSKNPSKPPSNNPTQPPQPRSFPPTNMPTNVPSYYCPPVPPFYSTTTTIPPDTPEPPSPTLPPNYPPTMMTTFPPSSNVTVPSPTEYYYGCPIICDESEWKIELKSWFYSSFLNETLYEYNITTDCKIEGLDCYDETVAANGDDGYSTTWVEIIANDYPCCRIWDRDTIVDSDVPFDYIFLIDRTGWRFHLRVTACNHTVFKIRFRGNVPPFVDMMNGSLAQIGTYFIRGEDGRCQYGSGLKIPNPCWVPETRPPTTYNPTNNPTLNPTALPTTSTTKKPTKRTWWTTRKPTPKPTPRPTPKPVSKRSWWMKHLPTPRPTKHVHKYDDYCVERGAPSYSSCTKKCSDIYWTEWTVDILQVTQNFDSGVSKFEYKVCANKKLPSPKNNWCHKYGQNEAEGIAKFYLRLSGCCNLHPYEIMHITEYADPSPNKYENGWGWKLYLDVDHCVKIVLKFKSSHPYGVIPGDFWIASDDHRCVSEKIYVPDLCNQKNSHEMSGSMVIMLEYEGDINFDSGEFAEVVCDLLIKEFNGECEAQTNTIISDDHRRRRTSENDQTIVIPFTFYDVNVSFVITFDNLNATQYQSIIDIILNDELDHWQAFQEYFLLQLHTKTNISIIDVKDVQVSYTEPNEEESNDETVFHVWSNWLNMNNKKEVIVIGVSLILILLVIIWYLRHKCWLSSTYKKFENELQNIQQSDSCYGNGNTSGGVIMDENDGELNADEYQMLYDMQFNDDQQKSVYSQMLSRNDDDDDVSYEM